MAFKKLRSFQKFDAVAFFEDKDVRVVSHEPWFDYVDGKKGNQLGTKYKCTIVLDKTKYKGDDVPEDLNGGEQVDVKVAQPPKKYNRLSRIKFVNPTANVYGDFQEKLSVQADDVEIQSK